MQRPIKGFPPLQTPARSFRFRPSSGPKRCILSPLFSKKWLYGRGSTHDPDRLLLPSVALAHRLPVRSCGGDVTRQEVYITTAETTERGRCDDAAAVQISCRFARGSALWARSLSGGKRIAAALLGGVRRRRMSLSWVRVPEGGTPSAILCILSVGTESMSPKGRHRNRRSVLPTPERGKAQKGSS